LLVSRRYGKSSTVQQFCFSKSKQSTLSFIFSVEEIEDVL